MDYKLISELLFAGLFLIGGSCLYIGLQFGRADMRAKMENEADEREARRQAKEFRIRDQLESGT